MERMSPELIKKLRAMREEKSKLTNPIDRIVFDNQWFKGLPVGLWLAALDGNEHDENENR